jgi:hypothetical protein
MITTLPTTTTGRQVRAAIGLADLEAHIRALIAVEPTPDVPLISCYTSFGPRLAETKVGGGTIFEERAATLRKSTRGEQRLLVDEALEWVYDYMAHDITPDTRGAAIFARRGPEPFFLGLQFQVSLPDWIVADAIPNIYHLVELKDTYHRFVLPRGRPERRRTTRSGRPNRTGGPRRATPNRTTGRPSRTTASPSPTSG